MTQSDVLTIERRKPRHHAVRAALTLLVGLAAARAGAQVPGRCETPVSERSSDIGCYVSAVQELGQLPDVPLFWHVYAFASRSAAEQVKAPRSTIVEAFGTVRLYAVREKDWRPATGERVAVIGPLPHATGTSYTARYLEGTIPPGERTPVHTHAGPEAWLVLAGAQCLETPDGITVARAGDTAVVGSGLPMMLSSVGQETRHTLVLVLHDSAQPWTMVMGDGGWKPAGRCPR